MRLERFFCRGNQSGMIGQAEIIVRAHVQHAFATGDRDVCILGTGDDTLGFEQALRFNFFERLRKLFFEFRDHRQRNYKSSHAKSTTDTTGPSAIRHSQFHVVVEIGATNSSCQIVNNC